MDDIQKYKIKLAQTEAALNNTKNNLELAQKSADEMNKTTAEAEVKTEAETKPITDGKEKEETLKKATRKEGQSIEEPYAEKFKRLMDKNSETNKKRFDFIDNQKNMTADEIKRVSDELTKESEDFVTGMNELSSRKKANVEETALTPEPKPEAGGVTELPTEKPKYTIEQTAQYNKENVEAKDKYGFSDRTHALNSINKVRINENQPKYASYAEIPKEELQARSDAKAEKKAPVAGGKMVGESKGEPLGKETPEAFNIKIAKIKDEIKAAREKAKNISDAKKNLSIISDSFKQAELQAKADRQIIDGYVKLAGAYIEQGVKTLKEFTEKIGGKVDDLIATAWNEANKKEIDKLEIKK